MISDVFGYFPLFSAGDNGRADFGICGPGITIDESVAVSAAVPAHEDVGNGS